MMQKANFWTHWAAIPSRQIFLFFTVFWALALVGCLYLWHQGSHIAIQWQTIPQLHTQPVVAESFSQLSFDFTLDADTYYITEHFHPFDATPNTWYARLYLLLTISGMVLLLTVSTFLSRVPFAIICAVIALELATCGFEQMAIAGLTFSQLPLMVGLILFLLPAYYFQGIAQHIPFGKRLAIFAFLAALTTGIVAWQGRVSSPLMYWIGYSYAIPAAMTALLIWLTGHELLSALFVFIANIGPSSTGNPIRHFAILGGIYLFIIGYDYLLDVGLADYPIFTISPFAWMFASLAIGFWSLWRKEPVLGSIIPVVPYGYFAFLGLNLVALGFISYAFATDNTSLLKSVEDWIRYGQFSVGLIFYLYILVNFTAPMRRGLAVQKAMYQGKLVAYGFVNIAAVVVAVVMAGNADFFVFQQAKAGYFIYQGDMERAQGDTLMSEQNYKFALAIDPYSHRGNYSLAALAEKRGDAATALFFYSRAAFLNPHPADYAAAANIMTHREQLIDAIAKLREGLLLFPQEGRLINNLALLHDKNHFPDSALYYLQRAQKYLSSSTTAESNYYGLAIRNRIALSPDSLQRVLQPRDQITTMINDLAMRNLLQQPTSAPLEKKFLPDSAINLYQFCYLYNYTLNTLGKGDTSVISWLDRYAQVPANQPFVPYLQLAKALKLRQLGQYGRAYQLLQRLHAEAPSDNPYYANLLGLLSLQVEEYQEGARFFLTSYRRGNAEAFLNHAICTAELHHRRAESVEDWLALAQSGNKIYQQIAHEMLKVIHPDSIRRVDINAIDEEQKFRLIHYNHQQLTEENFNKILQTIQSPAIKIQVLTERIKYHLSQENLEAALAIRQAITGLQVPQTLTQLLLETDLRLLYAQGRYKEMGELLKDYQPQPPFMGYKFFYEGLYALSNNNFQQAEQLFKQAIDLLPQKQECYVELASLYNRLKQPQKAYEVLVDVLHTRDSYHDYPPRVYELYALQCLEMGYDDFAEEAISKLEDILPPKRYAKLLMLYKQRKAEIERQREAAW